MNAVRRSLIGSSETPLLRGSLWGPRSVPRAPAGGKRTTPGALGLDTITITISVTCDRRITASDPPLLDLLGVASESLAGHDLLELIHQDSRTDFLSEHSGLVAGTRSRVRREVRLETHRVADRWVVLTGHPAMFDRDGRPSLIAYTLLPLVRRLGHAHSAGETDPDGSVRPATSVNRLLELTADLTDRVPRQGHFVAVMCGRLTAPGVTCRQPEVGTVGGCDLAAAVSAALRSSDSVLRTGSGEVVVLADGLRDMAAAGLVAEVIGGAMRRTCVDRQMIASTGASVNVGTALSAPGEDPRQLLDAAVAALSEAVSIPGDRACIDLLVEGLGTARRVVALAPRDAAALARGTTQTYATTRSTGGTDHETGDRPCASG